MSKYEKEIDRQLSEPALEAIASGRVDITGAYLDVFNLSKKRGTYNKDPEY